MTKKLLIKAFCASILCLIIIIIILPCSAQQYTLFEENFECENWTNGKPNGWESLFQSNLGQLPTTMPYPDAYSGSCACRVMGNTNNITPTQLESFSLMVFTDSTEFFPIYWGKKYVLSFAAKTIGSYGDVKLRIGHAVKQPNRIFIRDRHYEHTIRLTSDWQQFEIEFIPQLNFTNTITGPHAPISSLNNTFGITVSGVYDFVIDHIKLVAKDRTMEFDYLEANNIKAYIDPINSFSNWSSPSHDIQYFEVPKNSGKSTIFTTNLWLGGLDEQDNLYVAAHRFCQIGFDFFVGPISDDYTTVMDTVIHPNYGGIFEKNVVSDAFTQKYHHTWKVTKTEIEYHKTHYADANYVMPWGIANWPAHGRTAFGESWNLAPYKEVDGNGWYTPSGGDYPEIRGDEAVLFIMNDALNFHSESQPRNGITVNDGRVLGMEIIGMAYAFNSGNEALQNTLFLSYYLRNKSTNNYKDFYFGFWTDFDLGYAQDDYIGCDTLLNMLYVYNGMEIDGTGQSWAYGANPPAQGAIFLNQKMSAFVYHNNADGATGDPLLLTEYYNMLRAIWKDGTPMTMWGNGYNPGSTDYTTYMFTGDPVAGTGWIEAAPMGPGSQPNAPHDKRGLMSAGPFTLAAGKSLGVDIALPFARSTGKSSLDALSLLKIAAEEVQEYYDEHIRPFPFIGIKEQKVSNGKLRVYPNPSNGRFTIESKQIIESIELYDIMGKKVFSDVPKKQTIQINMRLPQGLYIYRAVLEGNTVSSGKIIVQ